MQNINKYFDKMLRPLFKNPSYSALYLIHSNWASIMGAKYTKYSRPAKVHINNNETTGRLNVITHNPATSFYLNNNKTYLLEKINGLFGYRAISSIAVVEVPKIILEPKKREERKLTPAEQNYMENISVQSEVLKQRLQELYYSIKQKE